MMLSQFSPPNQLPFDVGEMPSIQLMHLCRMCAGTCSKKVALYGPEGIAHELATKFCNYLPVKVSETDTLPLQLCYDCTNLLIQWDAAVLVAIAADKKLKALQWREQFKQRSESSTKSSNESNIHRVSDSVPKESLSCSVCSKSGMVFRDLIEHLKSHKMPSSPSKDYRVDFNASYSESTMPDEAGDFDLDRSVNADLLEPLVCLETPGSKRKIRPKRKSEESNQSPSNTDDATVSVRSRKRILGKQDESSSENSEGGSEDGVVTSSTSGGFSLLRKPNDITDGDSILPLSLPANSKSNQNSNLNSVQKEVDPTPFRPKVRIISAESINQSLEERAKANQTAKSSESHMANPLSTAHSLQSVLKPIAPASASTLKKTIVLPGGVFKVDGLKAPSKVLKLPDGRFVRLLETRLPGKGGKILFAPNSAVLQRPIPTAVLSQLGKDPLTVNQSSDLERTPIAQTSSRINFTSSVVNIAPAQPPLDTNRNSDACTASKKTFALSDTKIISFNHQPGPRISGSRYVCMFCGKRNLTQDSLEDHAKSHSKDKADEVTISSDLSD